MDSSALTDAGMLFYVVSPNNTSFETLDEVPNYGQKCIPYFVVAMACEQIYLFLSKRPMGRLYEMLHSTSHGAFEQAINALFHTWRFALYSYIYENWRIYTLPWNSLWTWWICFFLIDFLYYWGHRACHEVNFLWAAHQVHHSSEDYNLASGFRQSAIQYYLQGVFYLPLALAIPPSVVLVHLHFNLISQFWLHTETIKSIGPLEYIINAPSHHRVHHGRNRYCLDKNYAGFLIIWDRIFGTFQAEDDTVVYGLVQNVNSYDMFHVQTHYYKKIFKTFSEMTGWKNKLYVLVKGPGWSPGKPRLGNPEDVPEIEYPVKKFEIKIDSHLVAYGALQGVPLILILFSLDTLLTELPPLPFFILVSFFILSLSSLNDLGIGRDNWNTELLRITIFFALEFVYLNHCRTTLFTPLVLSVFRVVHLVSILICTKQALRKAKKSQQEKID